MKVPRNEVWLGNRRVSRSRRTRPRTQRLRDGRVNDRRDSCRVHMSRSQPSCEAIASSIFRRYYGRRPGRRTGRRGDTTRARPQGPGPNEGSTMPPCLSLRGWYQSADSDPVERRFRTAFLRTPVSRFHAEPCHPRLLPPFEALTKPTPLASYPGSARGFLRAPYLLQDEGQDLWFTPSSRGACITVSLCSWASWY